MVVRFWGVRGSIPTPLRPETLRRKIASIVQRIRPTDLEDAESRERFLAQLPDWLFGTVGGNTTCLEVRASDGTLIVFDGGSGMRELGPSILSTPPQDRTVHLFFTHLHYDHVQGIPFFAPAYHPDYTIHFYSPRPDLSDRLNEHMHRPFFPVHMEEVMRSQREFAQLAESGSQSIGSLRISWLRVNHPGGACAYRLEEDGCSLIFCPDVALSDAEFGLSPENRAFFDGANVLIMDAQYTLGEAIEKYDWGHSSYSLVVDFALAWRIRRLYLFHHEPRYGDQKLERNLQAARWYAARASDEHLEIDLAREGGEVTLP